jgi:signal transduction histidine kinase
LEDEPIEGSSFQQQLLSLCREASENLLEMLRGILEADRSSRGAMLISPNPVLVSRLLRTSFNLTRPFAEESRIHLLVEHPLDLLTARSDTAKIERVLVNLITNAIKFSPMESQIRIGAESACLQDKDAVRFFVEDEGPGVLTADKERIFQKFNVGAAKGTRGEESFGIGLSFCKMIVEAHGGVIGVEDANPTGSRFYFVIPCEPDSAMMRPAE